MLIFTVEEGNVKLVFFVTIFNIPMRRFENHCTSVLYQVVSE